MLKDLLHQKQKLLDQLAPLQKELGTVEDQINAAVAVPLKAAMEGKKDTGTVKFDVDGIAVKAVVPKTVKWDQEKLAGIFQKIASAGDDPGQYIETKYGVSETAYKKWSDPVKKVFLPARTVVPGKPKLEFHLNEDSMPPWEDAKEERAA